MQYMIAKVSGSDFDVPKAILDGGSFGSILQIVFGIAAAVALIVLMLASLRYVTSQGDASAVAKAKNTIIYAIIGLAITATSFSIVTFVVKAL